MREIGIWLQTEQNQNVQIQYYIEGENEKSEFTSPVYQNSTFNIYHFKIGDLKPGEKYSYNVLVDGKSQMFDYPLQFHTQSIWKHREDASDFSFLIGSCLYVNDPFYDRPGTPYGGSYNILKEMDNTPADFMVWLGDNLYLREPDWDSRSGIYYRFKHTRALKELQPLLASKHHYAIWDDHDYGPNDSNYTFYGKNWTKSAFQDYWLNPVYDINNSGGINGYFTWNDCAFYLLDNRWSREPAAEKGTLLGEKQKKWLIDALQSSDAKFNFVCIGSQFLNDQKLFENYANFENERFEIINSIQDLELNNIVFLTGDRHHSEVSHLQLSNGNNIYDITSSPLTSTAHPHPNEPNSHRVPGSHYGKRSYAIISVSGTSENRIVKVSFCNEEGKVVYENVLKF
jgi:alkaline phosphatase D